MKDRPRKGKTMLKLSRRDFLKAGAAGLGVAAVGGLLPDMLLAAKAPAFKKGTSLSILQGSYFIAPSQDLYKRQAQEWGEANGVKMSCDFLNWPDLQPKIAASVQAGGYDIVELWGGWNYLYKDNLVDVADIAEPFGKRNGGWERYVELSYKVGNRCLGVPHGYSNGSMAYRISWFKEAGCPNAEDGNKVDLTWEEYFAIGKKCKAKGHPFGQALGHSTGDPPGVCYPYMWAYGAMEVEKDGKTIAFNKPQFVEGMRKFIEGWKDAYDETGTSWDDSNNNRAYLSGQISSTFNGSSIYFAAKKDKPEIAADTHHMLIPKGPAGRFYWLDTRTFAILKNSKNVPAAKAFLKWWFEDKQFGDWWRSQEGYMLQPVKKYYNDPVWFKDPKMAPFREQPKYGQNMGFAGPPNEKAAMAWSKYIVVDTFAKAVQGGDAKKAVEWGADQLKRIYDR
jgi:multiple sugar transport system substrate-binding protein